MMQIPLVGINPEENIIEKDTCTPMFIAALLTIVRTWAPKSLQMVSAAMKLK